MEKIDLTYGNILEKLFKLALPIILTGFMETTYNLVDMFWIGKLGTPSVASVGTAGFYIWLSFAFIHLIKTGTSIKVAQKTGENDIESAKSFAQTGIILGIIFGVLYVLFLLIFRSSLIGVFNIKDETVVKGASSYLLFIAPGIFFCFINMQFTGIFNGRGNSSIPFKINVIGLIFNMILDPILIFGFGPIKPLSIVGASLATTSSYFISLLLYIYYIKYKNPPFDSFKILNKLDTKKAKEILHLGAPVCMYNAFFTGISMVLAIIVAKYGPSAIAAQKVGSQIESISWLTALGLSTAICTFTAQNYGAEKFDRIYKGFKTSLKLSFALGLINTVILYFGSTYLMQIFFGTDTETIAIGASYLKILAISQIFMCVEITITGIFNGLSKTGIPTITSTILNLIRIPLALFLTTYFGVDGIWIAITISSILKGIVILVLFYIYLDKNDNFKFNFKHIF